MGRIIVLTIVLILLLLKKGYGCTSKGNDSLDLHISGKVSFKGNPSDRVYRVELIRNNKVIDSVEVKDGRSFEFALNKNEYYGIRILKKGFISKLVSVCTDMNASNKHAHHFRFYTKLINERELDRLNRDMLDFPIAVISFSEKKGSFYYSKRYTAYIKRKMYGTC